MAEKGPIDRVYSKEDRAALLSAIERSEGQWHRTETGAEWVERLRSGRRHRLSRGKRGRRR
jgi:hypothetical protein